MINRKFTAENNKTGENYIINNYEVLNRFKVKRKSNKLYALNNPKNGYTLVTCHL